MGFLYWDPYPSATRPQKNGEVWGMSYTAAGAHVESLVLDPDVVPLELESSHVKPGSKYKIESLQRQLMYIHSTVVQLGQPSSQGRAPEGSYLPVPFGEDATCPDHDAPHILEYPT